MSKHDTHKINGQIVREFKEVILVNSEGINLGKMYSIDALHKAQDVDLDLVLVGAGPDGATCRILDYNKLLYTANTRKSPKKQETSCVQFSLGIDINDYRVKINKVLDLISKGAKVVVSLRCRGREMERIGTNGLDVINRVINDLEGKVRVDIQPKVEGRFVNATLAPPANKSAKAKNSTTDVTNLDSESDHE
jgi:translation initiation factor IF-3